MSTIVNVSMVLPFLNFNHLLFRYFGGVIFLSRRAFASNSITSLIIGDLGTTRLEYAYMHQTLQHLFIYRYDLSRRHDIIHTDTDREDILIVDLSLHPLHQ